MNGLEQQIVPHQAEIAFGDYTKEREGWLGNHDLNDLFDVIKCSEKIKNILLE